MAIFAGNWIGPDAAVVTLTGTLDPDVTGQYHYERIFEDHPVYTTIPELYWLHSGPGIWVCLDAPPEQELPPLFNRADDSPIGPWAPLPPATGIPTGDYLNPAVPFDPAAFALRDGTTPGSAQLRRFARTPNPTQQAYQLYFTRLMKYYRDDVPDDAKQEWEDEGADRQHENRFFEDAFYTAQALFVCLTMPKYYAGQAPEKYPSVTWPNLVNPPGTWQWDPFPSAVTWTIPNPALNKGNVWSGLIGISCHRSLDPTAYAFNDYELRTFIPTWPLGTNPEVVTFDTNQDYYTRGGVSTYVRYFRGHEYWSDGKLWP